MLAGWIREGVSLRGSMSSNRNTEVKPSLKCFCVTLAVKGQIHETDWSLGGWAM